MKTEFNLLAARAGTTPEDLQRLTGNCSERINFIKGVVDDLEGSYLPDGIHRWFARPRVQLDGLSPLEALGTAWRPQQDIARRVKALSAALRN